MALLRGLPDRPLPDATIRRVRARLAAGGLIESSASPADVRGMTRRTLFAKVAYFAAVAGIGSLAALATWHAPARSIKVDAPMVTVADSTATAAVAAVTPAPKPTFAAPIDLPQRTPPISHQDLRRERLLLDRARQALGRGDGEAAMAPLRRHARDFPAGALAQERDAMRVNALVLLGETSRAVREGRAFHAQYPRSLFGPVVDAALTTAGALVLPPASPPD